MWAKNRPHLVLLFLSIIISAFIRIPYFQYDFIFVDEAWWANGARVLHQGGKLYVDVALDKNPPIFWFCAVLFRILGVNMNSIHWGSLLVVWITSILLYLLGSRFFSPAAGGATVLVYAFATTTYYIPRIIGMNTETLMVLFTTAAALCYLHALLGCSRRSAYLLAASGFLSAWALLTKPVAITETALLAALLLLARDQNWRSKLGRLTHFLAGFAIALGSLIVYMADAGMLLPWWDQAVLFGFRYASSVSLGAFFIKSLRAPSAFIIIFAWLFMLIWVSRKARDESPRAYVFVLLWSLAAFAGVAIGRRYYANYFLQMMPPLSLLGGVGLTYLWKMRKRDKMLWLRRICCTAFMISFLWFHSRTLANWLSYPYPQIHRIKLWNMWAENQKSLKVAQYLKRKTLAHDRIFVWGSNPELYFLSQRDPATPWLVFDVADDYPPRAGEPEMQARAAQLVLDRKPRYIVDVQQIARIEDYPSFHDLVASHYELECQIDGVRLFRLR